MTTTDLRACDYAACRAPATSSAGGWSFCAEHAEDDRRLAHEDSSPAAPATVTVTFPAAAVSDDRQLVQAVRQALKLPRRDTPSTPTPTVTDADEHRDVLDLPMSALFADPAYQRPLDTKRVDRMLADYDPALIGVLEVSDRQDGTYAIVDGQHRWALLRNVHDDEHHPIACHVHRDLDRDQEAALFYDIDASRRNLTGWDRWVARRSADDPAVLDIERICAQHGLHTGDRARPGEPVLRATRTAETILEAGGAPLLTEVLHVAVAIWGIDDPDALTNGPLSGLAEVLQRYNRDQLDLHRLIDRLKGITPRQLKARASGLRERHPGTTPRLTAAVMVEAYNAGLSVRDRLEPFSVRVRPQSQPGRAAPPAVTRACRVCDAPLVKKPGPGRWPAYCPTCRTLPTSSRVAGAA